MNSQLKSDPPNLDQLLKMSKDVRKHSYAPYSKFTVGAALVCEDDTIYTGCNVENAAYSMAICAERTAMVKAVSEGHQKFKTIVINSSLQKVFTSPCGACRQFMAEFGLDWDVYMTKEDLSYKKATVGELLPEAFGPFILLDHYSSSQKD